MRYKTIFEGTEHPAPGMNKSFTYIYPVASQVYNNTQPQVWSKVQQAWESGDFYLCITELLTYLGVSFKKNKRAFKLRHGSATIHLQITGEELIIEAPFLDISSSQKIPLLRQATQLNFEPLTISRIVLKDEQLTFNFRCALNMCEPYKIFDVLKEICIHADNYDDAFIRRFKADRILQPELKHFSEAEIKTALQYFKTTLNETIEAVQFLEQKRMHAYIWDVLMLMLLRIDFSLSPQGHLRGRIEYYITEMLTTFDLSEKINTGKAVLKEFSKLSDENIIEDLYQIQTLVPFKTLATAETVKSRLQRALLQLEKEYQDGQYLACSLTAPFHLLYLMYEHTLDEANYNLVKDLLPSGSAKPFKDVAEHYRAGLKEILAGITELPVLLPETEHPQPFHSFANPVSERSQA